MLHHTLRIRCNIIYFILLYTLLLSCIASSKDTIPATVTYQELPQRLNTLINKSIPNTRVGIMLTDANTGYTLYQHNAYQYFIPASTTKLFTAAAVLYSIKPNFRYKTNIYRDQAKINKHTLRGNIYIQFNGDPSLTSKNLVKLLLHIKKQGIQQIQGNIIVDNHQFIGNVYPQGMVKEDQQWSYGAPIDAIIINENNIPITIASSDVLDRLVQIQPAPRYHPSFVTLKSDVKTVTESMAEDGCAFNVAMQPQYREVQINGCWPINKKAYRKIAITNPFLFAKHIIKTTLQKENIKLEGSIELGALPKNAHLIATHSSTSILNIIRHMLQFSNNVYANALLKTLGAQKKAGDFFTGIKALQSILSKQTDINFKRMQLFDGAGLSRYNLIMPSQLNQLLYAVYHSPIKEKFFSALALPQKNGTLAHRMYHAGLKKHVHAKTGTMMGIKSITGYLENYYHQKIIFSISINEHLGDEQSISKLEDQIIGMLYGVNFKRI